MARVGRRMIVGVKRRSNSRKIYDIGVVLHEATDWRGGICGYSIRTFNINSYGRHYRYSTNEVWHPIRRVVIICDEKEPSNCENETCEHRFTCFTNDIKV